MIKDKCFTEEWLDQFKKQKDYKRTDKIIFEKMIYALHLLERLKANGLSFVFKGGSSLLLLLKEGNRFSIDIDIICKEERKDLEEILNNLAAKILVNDMSPINYYEGQDVKALSIEEQDWNFLNKLKKQPDKSSFFYWYQTVQIITKKENEK